MRQTSPDFSAFSNGKPGCIYCERDEAARNAGDWEQMLTHRVPIDCWTHEDQAKWERQVWVVAWVGDEDCGGRNDGPIAVYRSRSIAMRRALTEAIEEASHNPLDGPVEPGESGFRVGRAECAVFQLEISVDEEE